MAYNELNEKADAIINYFRLLNLTERSDDGMTSYSKFVFMDGIGSLKKLVTSCQNNNIDIFSNTIDDLYKQLRDASYFLNSDDLDEALIAVSSIYKKYSAEIGNACHILIPRLPVDQKKVSVEVMKLLDAQFLSKPKEK